MRLTVLSPFTDIYDSRRKYAIGDKIDIEDSERVRSLLGRGLVSMSDSIAESKTVNIYQSLSKMKPEVELCTDVEVLKRALADEEKQESPRKGVISLLNERIGQL